MRGWTPNERSRTRVQKKLRNPRELAEAHKVERRIEMPESERKVGNIAIKRVERRWRGRKRMKQKRIVGKKVQRMKLAAMMNEPKLISSRFNYNGVDNNIIRAWYPTVREIPSSPVQEMKLWPMDRNRETRRSGTNTRREKREGYARDMCSAVC